MIYEDVGSAGYYSNVAFNGTIEVVEKAKLVDMEGIFMYLMIFAALAGTGMGGMMAAGEGGRGAGRGVWGVYLMCIVEHSMWREWDVRATWPTFPPSRACPPVHKQSM